VLPRAGHGEGSIQLEGNYGTLSLKKIDTIKGIGPLKGVNIKRALMVGPF
jgi:hypothetical protein